ncbi:MAG TPA: valine--tRNA ligase [Myxococcota bacterium]|nr:valine--tRNA ligase [Myxococcota bacterium]
MIDRRTARINTRTGMSDNLSTHYHPAEVEARWAGEWIAKGCFEVHEGDSRPAFSIVIPPPNITGTLHMGHALTLTIQDVIVRYKRMSGFNCLWLPGTDHAGIATQMVVERALAKEGLNRHDIGRQAFIEKVWEWKQRHGNRISEQTKAMGASVDWRHERFTMDAGLSRAVREVFVQLYEDGLIYRDQRLINWCPRCRTALSDLEVTLDPTEGKLWTIEYPLLSGKRSLAVATTRPETMLGDTAVAVHPDDPRYKDLIGQKVELPLSGRAIPVIADAELVDPEFGTGCVKVTPAHDFNDFETGRRHGLESIGVIDVSGKMTAQAGPDFAGLDRFAAREKVVAALEKQGRLAAIEDYKVELSLCQRCSEVVEPLLSKQWFVNVKPLAEEAIRAVEQGRTVFVPRQWEKTYFDWMHNIRDWCISRQLWWGHRIPAWFCDCGEVIVSRTDPSACPSCGGTNLTRDPDVLDTWFSSALWPFSTLGWPDRTDLLKTFYPTSLMETGFDIIFFWVARMMMMGLKFMGDIPFRTVYLHAMVRDAQGQKMSKTKGNVIDPLDVTVESGADALRFTLASLTAQGRDIKLSVERVEGYRHFINKIWNASRFVLLNLDDYDPALPGNPESRSVYDRWILARARATIEDVESAINDYKLNEASSILYNFFWHELCDWYLEMIKPVLNGRDGPEARRECQGILVRVLDVSVRLLHPFTPFVTEEIWQKLPLAGRESSYLATAGWPRSADIEQDPEALEQIGRVVAAVIGIRNIRGESGLPPGKLLPAHLLSQDERVRNTLQAHQDTIIHLGRLESLTIGEPSERPAQSAVYVSSDLEVCVPLGGLIDFKAERNRLGKEIKKTRADHERSRKKLENESFLKQAPPAVISKEKAKLAEFKERLAKLDRALEQIAEWERQ